MSNDKVKSKEKKTLKKSKEKVNIPEDNSQSQQITDQDQSISKKFSAPSDYIQAKENITNLENIKNNLLIEKSYIEKFNSALKDLKEENNEIYELYENEDKMNEQIETKNMALKLDNESFKHQARKIFSDVYGLKEKILYPYFSIEHSLNKKSNTIKIYYYKVEFKTYNQDSTSFIFLDDKDTYLICYKNMPMIFQKEKGIFNNLTVITPDYKNYIDFQIKKDGDEFQSSFLSAEICEEVLAIKGKVNETKNKVDSMNNPDLNPENENNKKILKEKLKFYEEKYNLIKNKYSKERLNNELVKKKRRITTFGIRN